MFIVTGASGLIGSAVVWALNNNGIEDILCVDSLGTSEKWLNLRALKFSDYVEKEVFRENISRNAYALSDIEAVIHMGACSATTEKDAAYLIDNNYNYSKELCEFCLQHNIRFIYASSCATYGDGSLGYDDDESKIHLLRPLNMYGYSKQLFDLWAAKRGFFSQITGLKFSNVYGVNEGHKGEMRSMVCRAYEQIVASKEVRLFKSYRKDFADGEQKRDFLYVKDAVDMIMFLLNHSRGYGLFNIGSGRAESWNHLAECVFEAMDTKKNIQYIEMPEYLQGKYQYYTKSEMKKLQNLGYDRPPASLKEAIADYIGNYKIPGKLLGD